MKIISWNVNGLRGIYQRNFLRNFKKINADFFCLQETKAQIEQLPTELLNQKRYYPYFNSAIRKGYGGVAIYTKKKPLKINSQIGLKRFDEEGRFLELDYSNFILINVYLPHGGRDKSNLGYKLKAYDYFIKYLKSKIDKKVILVGDFNIAHEEIDLARPKQNQNNIMFTLKERSQIDRLIKVGFSDSFRIFNKKGGNYTWWPYFANARKRNLGWRIDYIFISNSLNTKLKKASILNKIMGSDHCPTEIDINLSNS